jgi:hypothetical protein
LDQPELKHPAEAAITVAETEFLAHRWAFFYGLRRRVAEMKGQLESEMEPAE